MAASFGSVGRYSALESNLCWTMPSFSGARLLNCAYSTRPEEQMCFPANLRHIVYSVLAFCERPNNEPLK